MIRVNPMYTMTVTGRGTIFIIPWSDEIKAGDLIISNEDHKCYKVRGVEKRGGISGVKGPIGILVREVEVGQGD